MPPDSARVLVSALADRSSAAQHLVDARVVRRLAVVAHLEAQHLARGEERIEVDLLRHQAHQLAAPPSASRTTSCPSTRARRRGGAHQAADDRDPGGLAGAVRAEQREDLAGFDRRETPASAVRSPYRFLRPSVSTARSRFIEPRMPSTSREPLTVVLSTLPRSRSRPASPPAAARDPHSGPPLSEASPALVSTPDRARRPPPHRPARRIARRERLVTGFVDELVIFSFVGHV